MGENRTSISNASTYREIGEFWDTHDLSDYWDRTHDVEMDINIRSSSVYFPVEKSLAEKLRIEAESRGVSPGTLLNEWVQEHVGSEPVPK